MVTMAKANAAWADDSVGGSGTLSRTTHWRTDAPSLYIFLQLSTSSKDIVVFGPRTRRAVQGKAWWPSQSATGYFTPTHGSAVSRQTEWEEGHGLCRWEVTWSLLRLPKPCEGAVVTQSVGPPAPAFSLCQSQLRVSCTASVSVVIPFFCLAAGPSIPGSARM